MALALALRAGARFAPGIGTTGALRSAATGRFITTAEAAALTYARPGSHAACGKGQYKSLECKKRAIAKNAMRTGTATAAQKKYLGA